ncbi:mRNA splicing protein sme1 [Brettanomyces nanus]|uniref:Small nuclear ribonucleoprotein E n=1 Tax=Eeniella nana TaxID=13502 RepID=A0A875S6P5_EENNA|nr:mRNA splicing protein sme1 [Brettanomyces nanus]QPG77006.1 mRNA splicing protein sme1 [Brettanomyces nanus]
MSGRKQQKVIVPPINQIFKYLQQQSNVTVWLYEQVGYRLTGVIKGFDEFMNVVIDDAVEISTSNPSKTRKLGRILLKGDNITLISCAQ